MRAMLGQALEHVEREDLLVPRHFGTDDREYRPSLFAECVFRRFRVPTPLPQCLARPRTGTPLQAGNA